MNSFLIVHQYRSNDSLPCKNLVVAVYHLTSLFLSLHLFNTKEMYPSLFRRDG